MKRKKNNSKKKEKTLSELHRQMLQGKELEEEPKGKFYFRKFSLFDDSKYNIVTTSSI